jgi:hypothetical protein
MHTHSQRRSQDMHDTHCCPPSLFLHHLCHLRVTHTHTHTHTNTYTHSNVFKFASPAFFSTTSLAPTYPLRTYTGNCPIPSRLKNYYKHALYFRPPAFFSTTTHADNRHTQTYTCTDMHTHIHMHTRTHTQGYDTRTHIRTHKLTCTWLPAKRLGGKVP